MLKNLLDKARDLKNQLDSLRPLSAEVEGRVMQKLRIDWNYHSNNMEGNTLTYGETRALLLYGMTAKGKPLSDHLEISGHEKAIEWLEDMARKKEELSGYFLRRLHEIIFSEQLNTKIKVGSYKEIPNFLISQTGETIQFATPEETPAKMQDLLDRFNKNEAKSDTNPILLAAAFHYEFVRIHPFEDGNGRMSRLLMNFILMRFGYPPAVIKTEDKHNYLAALQLADAKNNALPLAEYLSSAVIHSLELMLKGARGERIEEPSDLDKQLAMLERELNAINQKTRNQKVLEEFAENTFENIIVHFIQVTEKFKFYYNQRKYTADFEIFHDGTILAELKNLQYFYKNDIELLEHTYPEITLNSKNIIDAAKFAEELKISFTKKLPFYIKSIKNEEWQLNIIINYSNFCKVDVFSGFSYESTISIIFTKSFFTIKNKAIDIQLSKYYHEPLTEDELANFFTKEGNAHFAYIQQQIKEQQKSL